MDIKVGRSTEQIGTTCAYWLAGRCNRNPCRFLHRVTPSPYTGHHHSRKPHFSSKHHSRSRTVWKRNSGDTLDETNVAKPYQKANVAKPYQKANVAKPYQKANVAKPSQKPETNVAKTNVAKPSQKSEINVAKPSQKPETNVAETNVSQPSQKPSPPSICRYWTNDNCVHGDQCHDLHSWCYGDGFSTLAKLQGHNKVITGIALPVGSDKLYSGSTDGTVRTWDCHTGQCVNVINLGTEVTSLISEGPWIFVGQRNAVKAWNTQTGSEFTLDGPKGRILSMTVGNDTLFAAAEDGVITAWRGSSDAKSPFERVASLTGHTKGVVCLAVGGKRLYSGSMDKSIRVWDMDTLECKMTLHGHTDVVTSLICWEDYLLSSSFDCTIKIWAATEEGTVEVTYTHTEEKGVVTLFGMTDAEAKPILYVSCRDSSVRMYELPSFSERGRLFAKQEIRSIELGPDGLFFTGDGTGLLMVWKWLDEPLF